MPGAENAGKPGFYTVQRGDTLTRIALDNGQSWRDVAAWNQLSNANLIEVGQVLRVAPPNAITESSGVVVQPMGPATQAAMKQFPGTAVAEQNKGNDMSESQRIAELMNRLAQLEQAPQPQEQIADEGIADLAKGAWAGIKGAGGAVANKAKEIGSAFKAGVADPAGAKALAPAATKAGEKAALKTGAAVARNPGKVAAGSAAAGAAGMAALAGGAANKPADPTGNKPPAASGAPAAAPAASSLTTDEEGEMGVLAQELGSQMGRLPELDALLLQYEKLRPGAINAAP
jgi:LysM repeat protein